MAKRQTPVADPGEGWGGGGRGVPPYLQITLRPEEPKNFFLRSPRSPDLGLDPSLNTVYRTQKQSQCEYLMSACNMDAQILKSSRLVYSYQHGSNKKCVKQVQSRLEGFLELKKKSIMILLLPECQKDLNSKSTWEVVMIFKFW